MRARVEEKVVAPLRHAAANLAPAAARSMSQALAAAGPAARDAMLEQAAAGQRDLAAAVEEVLNNMKVFEDFQEAVRLLKDLLNRQENVNDATLKTQEEVVRKLLGGEKKP